METREASATDVHVPVICRACGTLTRFALTALQARGTLACRSCGVEFDLPEFRNRTPRLERAHAPARRRVSEFPSDFD